MMKRRNNLIAIQIKIIVNFFRKTNKKYLRIFLNDAKRLIHLVA